MEPTSGIKTWQWVVTVIVIIILVILGYSMFKGPSEAPINTNEPNVTGTTTNTTNSANRIMVADQAPGNIVYVSTVQLAAPGFVVIHKDNNGTPGDVIGSKYFEKGIYPGQITLTSSTLDGGMYYAVLHSDDGDKKFDVKKDLPIKDAAGSIIMDLFRVTVTPSELKG